MEMPYSALESVVVDGERLWLGLSERNIPIIGIRVIDPDALIQAIQEGLHCTMGVGLEPVEDLSSEAEV